MFGNGNICRATLTVPVALLFYSDCVSPSGGIPGSSWWGVQPGSPNSDPISDQIYKCHYLHPFSDLASKIHTRFQIWPPAS